MVIFINSNEFPIKFSKIRILRESFKNIKKFKIQKNKNKKLTYFSSF